MRNKGIFFKMFVVVAVLFLSLSAYSVFFSDPITVSAPITDGDTITASDTITATQVDQVQLESSEQSGEKQEESGEEQSEITREYSIVEKTFSEAWYNGEMLDFYSYYMQPADDFLCYEDYERTLGYMLLHNISEFTIVMKNPGFYADDIDGILEEIIQASTDLQLIMTPYTDLWNCANVGTTNTYVYPDDFVEEITFTVTLSNFAGMPEDTIVNRIVLGNMYCVNFINQMYDEGYLYEGMEDKEKIYLIYTYIVKTVSYDYDTIIAMEDDEITAYDSEARDFYTALVEKSSVCQGIASAMIQLCRMVDVPLYVQYGYADGEAHAWCKYQLEDESWVYFDPTWAISDYQASIYHPAYWCWVTQEFMEGNHRGDREFVDGIG